MVLWVSRRIRRLATMYMAQRTLRLADGPDAVHRMVVGRNELKKYID